MQKVNAFDIESDQEKCTPYMLAVLREQFEIAEILVKTGRVDKYFKNMEGETVFDIAKRLKIKNVQKFLIL